MWMLKSYLSRTGKTGKEINFPESELKVPEDKQVSMLSRTLALEEGDYVFNMSTNLLNGCLKNSEVLKVFPFQLSHLSSDQRQDVIKLVESFPGLLMTFRLVPLSSSMPLRLVMQFQ